MQEASAHEPLASNPGDRRQRFSELQDSGQLTLGTLHVKVLGWYLKFSNTVTKFFWGGVVTEKKELVLVFH
jgi:hypothetical protein